MYDGQFYSTPPHIPVNIESIDRRMAKLCNRLKQSEQYAQNEQTSIIEEMQELLELSGERDDINECVQTVITKIKEDESEHWRIADEWDEHFTELSADIEPDDDEAQDDDENGETESDEETDDDDKEDEDEEDN